MGLEGLFDPLHAHHQRGIVALLLYKVQPEGEAALALLIYKHRHIRKLIHLQFESDRNGFVIYQKKEKRRMRRVCDVG
jgi:hypothetical protein